MEAPLPTSARRNVSGDNLASPAACISSDDDDDDGCPKQYLATFHDTKPERNGAGTKDGAGLCAFLASTSQDCIKHALHPWRFLADSLKSRTHSQPPGNEAYHRFESHASQQEPMLRGSIVGPLCDILCSSWLNALLIFVPIGVASQLLGLSPLIVFISNAAAIVPLSALLTDATERVAAHAGDTIGALLNISLGNLVELILFVALAHGQVRIVEASILGSVLVNLLLILGSALMVGSTVNSEPSYNTAQAQLLACLLSVSVFTFLMPTTFKYTFDAQSPGSIVSLQLCRISSILILAIYIIYLVHELRARFPGNGNENGFGESHYDIEHNAFLAHCPRPDYSARKAAPPQVQIHQALPPRTIRYADEQGLPTLKDGYMTFYRDDLGSMYPSGSETDIDTDDSETRGRRNDRTRQKPRANSLQPLLPQKHLRSLSLGSRVGALSRDSSISRDMLKGHGFSRSSLATLQFLRDGHGDQEFALREPPLSQDSYHEVVVSIAMLFLTSGLMSLNAELLVGTIDDVTRQTKLSQSVIGLIILPIVGNIAEYVTVVAVAAKDKLDLAIAVSVGSSIQIALCVTPLTVIAGWVLNQNLALTFSFFEMATLLGGVLLVNLLILNESSSSLRTCGLKGALMCACYLIIGLGAYFAPANEG
ncbi:hypothetical protein HIM_09321 [Hirsutella minnesotensis 3608]|uniref:Sodium/calcium exchanger membrane region domain-containing protein n=1 Tax=Hirsutella minnesotensis 3608 TaxID=1043627 RepID=A0A0F7ZGQ7_9HYPO|nr:hypothetical protein HIM_09321 [Hirsutella minnesotensis 3608]